MSPVKALGQHFLSDARVADRIAEALEDHPGGEVVEIGPGLGALTSHLLERGLRVVAIEKDRRLAGALGEIFSSVNDRLTVVTGDILQTDLVGLPGLTSGVLPAVAGNLPYNISAPVLFHLLDANQATGPWVLMFQREVARRLRARPGTKEYGALTALITPLREPAAVCDVGRGAFHPPPKVDSAVLSLNPRRTSLIGDVSWSAYRRVVRAVFGARRKTLRNALKNGGIPDAGEVLLRAGVDPGLRGERLGVEELATIAAALPTESTGP